MPVNRVIVTPIRDFRLPIARQHLPRVGHSPLHLHLHDIAPLAEGLVAVEGGTGHWPVPSGYQPLGTTARWELFRAVLAKGSRLVIP